MIPNTSDRSVQSSMTGEKIAMRLDEKSTAHLMTVLTDLYEDPELAVLRESVTNARDSHIVAGNSAPIEVTLPTELSPSLKIKDYGVGLSRDDIVEIYSLYGASTKRESDDVNGVLGLGCKAPLTYTDQFIVVGVKNGVRTMVSVSREEDDSGTMTIVEESETDEPNGVEIIVPARRNNSFAEKAAELFQYWEAATVLVNGEEPARVDGLRISDKIMLVKGPGGYYSEVDDVLVMSGVPYKIPREYSPLARNGGYGLVAWIENGGVSFTPSRESLQMTGRTKARLETLKQEVMTTFTEAVNKEIAACTTSHEAFAKATEWRTASPRGIETLTYKGDSIPTSLVHDDDRSMVEARKQERIGSTKIRTINGQYAEQSLFVTNFEAKFASRHKAKLIQYCAENEINPTYFYLISGDFGFRQWLNPDRIVDWSEIKSIVVEKQTITTGYGHTKITGSYEGWVEGTKERDLLAEEIDQTKPIYYTTTSMFGEGRWYEPVTQHAVSLGIKGTIVHMSINRVNKFKRDFPKAKTLKEGLEAKHQEIVKSLPKAAVESMTLQQSHDAYILRKIDANKVDDPELRRAARLVKVDVKDKVEPLKKFRNHWSASALNLGKTAEPFGLTERYPLLDYRAADEDDLYIYVNAKYKAISGS